MILPLMPNSFSADLRARSSLSLATTASLANRINKNWNCSNTNKKALAITAIIVGIAAIVLGILISTSFVGLGIGLGVGATLITGGIIGLKSSNKTSVEIPKTPHFSPAKTSQQPSESIPLKPTSTAVDQKLAVASSPVDDITQYARSNCINEGTLRRDRDYIYLELDKNYLSQIFNKVRDKDHAIRAPKSHGKIGAHISVIRHDEWHGTPPQKISEIAQKFLFTPMQCTSVDKGRKRIWTLVVQPSTELAKLRHNHGLQPLPHGHDFHVTIGERYL